MTVRVRRNYAASDLAVKRRELWAWAGFDFANSGYTTVVITAIFNAYFVSVVAGNTDWATLLWTLTLSASYLVVMATSNWVGMYADANAAKKRLLIWTTLICASCTALLSITDGNTLILALLLILLSNTAFGLGENLIAAFLPELASEKGMGRLSGYGWALGYLGGMLLLGICLYWIQSAEQRGSETQLAVQQSMLWTAGAFVLAAIPTFVLLKVRIEPKKRGWFELLPVAWRRLRDTFVSTRDLPDLTRFLWCIVAYQAGVGTIITVAAIFTQQALGFTTAESIQLILIVNATAAVGAFLFGFVQDRLGHKPALTLSLLGWLVSIVILFASEDRTMFWVVANLSGLCLGASQSIGRALVGVMCPPDREGEVFGLWGLAVKFSMIVGPVSYGLISFVLKGDHRTAMLCIGVFFILGLFLLGRVNVEQGMLRAKLPKN